MGFDLKREGGDASQWTGVYWRLLLGLARHYGWKPAGTLAPEGVPPGEWEGLYETNDGQLVSGDDAVGLAAGLRAAEQAGDVEEVANALYGAQLREAWALLDEALGPEDGPGRPAGLLGRLLRALGLGREPAPPVAVESPPPREVPRLARGDVIGALGELHAYCARGAFRIW